MLVAIIFYARLKQDNLLPSRPRESYDDKVIVASIRLLAF